MKTKFGTLLESGEVVDEMSVDLNQLSSNDPMAFAYGMQCGRVQKKNDGQYRYSTQRFKKVHGSNYRELSMEYLRGFKLGYTGILLPEGIKIRKGTENGYLNLELNLLK